MVRSTHTVIAAQPGHVPADHGQAGGNGPEYRYPAAATTAAAHDRAAAGAGQPASGTGGRHPRDRQACQGGAYGPRPGRTQRDNEAA